MKIYIPTLDRADQITLRNLPMSIKMQVVSLTQPGGIGKVRQYALDECRRTGDTFVMLDDDLRFATRRDDDPTKFRDSTPEEIERMFSILDNALEGYAHVGVASREGGNRNTDEFVYNTRNLRILGFNAKMIPEYVRFDRLPVMEDFDVALQLLRLGLPSVQINWIVHDQKQSNAPGGCSTYRTKEVQREAAYGLAREHPEFVTVVEKETKTAWGGGVRTDVRIAWKKAYAAGASSKAMVLDVREGSGEVSEGAGGE
jgi:hypothetical protein